MAKDGNDILMQMVLANGTPMPAECQTDVDTDYDDFVAEYTNGTFFEIESFTFGMNLDERDQTKDKLNVAVDKNNNTATQAGRAGAAPIGRSTSALTPQQATTTPVGKFGRWKSAKPSEIADMLKNRPYPLRMDEFSVTRFYDRASPVLFEKCCNSESFQSTSLIKRKLIGAGNTATVVTGDAKLKGFLRIDFGDVLVTHVEWQNSDPMKETIKFVFRNITVQYRIVTFKSGSAEAFTVKQQPVSWQYEAPLVKPSPPSSG